MFKRTEGVSTTDIVGKLLMLTTTDSSKTRDRGYSHEKPMRTSEYISEARRLGEEELKDEQDNLGQVAKSEGIIGLTRALFFAGANNMLVSLWKVSDQSTASIMEKFYGICLKNDQKFSQSLGEVKREWIKTSNQKNPYYWASFILVGN